MELGGRYFTSEELKEAGFIKIGRNVKIHNRASIYGTENIVIGDHVRIDDFSIIIATGKVMIGTHVSIGNYCYLGATNGLVLEDFVTLAPGVKLFTASDDYSGIKLTNPTIPKKYTGGSAGEIKLGRHVIIGAGTVVLPGCSIGEGCSIGSLSLIKNDLEPWGIYAGIPVKRLRDRKKDILLLEKKLKEEEAI